MTAAASVRVRPLDPKFAKVVALMRSTQHEGERDNARAMAERLAADAGMTLDEAEAIATKPKASVKGGSKSGRCGGAKAVHWLQAA